MTGRGEEFTCANCGGRFTKGWSDEEAAEEARALIPAEDLADGVVTVCDDCHSMIVAWARVNAPELLRE